MFNIQAILVLLQIIPVFVFSFQRLLSIPLFVVSQLEVCSQNPFMKSQPTNVPAAEIWHRWAYTIQIHSMFFLAPLYIWNGSFLQKNKPRSLENHHETLFARRSVGTQAQRHYPTNAHHPPTLIPFTDEMVTCRFIFKGLTSWQMNNACMSYDTLISEGVRIYYRDVWRQVCSFQPSLCHLPSVWKERGSRISENKYNRI